MATSMTSIVGDLKNVYDDYVEKQQNLKHLAIDEISKSLAKYSPGGNGYYGSINDYGNESVGAINELESFRTIDNEDYLQWKVSPKVLVAPIQFSGLVAAAADGGEESFVGAVVDALDMAKTRLTKDENRQFYGLGTGLLFSPAGTLNSNATSFTVDNTQYVRENMVLDAYSATTLTVAGIRVTGVDRVNSVVYFSTSIGFALTTTAQFVKQNIRVSAPTDGKEMMGLRGIVDDSTDLQTFQSLDSSINFVWRSYRLAAAGANLTSDIMQRLIDGIAVLNGEEPDKLIMHRKQRRKYLDIVVPQKRYQDGDLDTGFTKATFNGMELWLDYDCQVDTIYGIKLDKLRKFELKAMAMGSQDGSDEFLRVINADQFQAYWRHYSNFGTSQRNAHGKITGLAVPSGLA